MFVVGLVIAIGAAIAFLLLGALALFGGARATQDQIVPGFRPDRPGMLERALTLLSVWGTVALVAVLCLLAAIRIFDIVLRAL
jgi:hypothetical protein